MCDLIADLPASYPSYIDDLFITADNPVEFVDSVEAILKTVGGKFSKTKHASVTLPSMI